MENQQQAGATACPHLPQLITYWHEDAQGNRTPREAIVSDWQREHFPYSPFSDSSLVCRCGRERLEIQLVEVENWRGVVA